MKIKNDMVPTLLLTDLDRLDPIKVFYEDFEIGQGQITIICYGEAWTAYWGAIGERSIIEFVLSCDEHYLAKNLSNISSTVIDYDAIGKEINNDVDRDNLAMFFDELSQVYGHEWYMDLPEITNPDYQYLCRIILAVQAGLKEYLTTVK